MTPQERDLIDSIFSRLTQTAGAPRDAEAAQLIAQRARALPDATYALVQAVAVQEMTLRQAQAHIAELERRLAGGDAGGGSFLGGARGASVIPSVPQQPVYQAPPVQAPSAAGSFLRSAATTAAGVAGGVLLAEGISSLFGGSHFGGGWGGSPWGGGSTYVENNYYGPSSGGDFAGGADGGTFAADSDADSDFGGGSSFGGGDDGGWG